MSKYHVSKSITINAPIEKVYENVANFQNWTTWSPWLCMEADARVDVIGTPGTIEHNYSWKGNLVGEGSMGIEDFQEYSDIWFDLNFIKPFKSHAKTAFSFTAESPESTVVTWTMDGKMPFFLFFMTKMMALWIGADYERGLSMLKSHIETGKVYSQTQIDGESITPEISYIGYEQEVDMQDIGTQMEYDFRQLQQLIQESDLVTTGKPFSLYTKWDLKNQKVGYIAGISVDDKDLGLAADDMVTGQIDSMMSIQVTHTGEYRHVGNAWATAFGYIRNLKRKPKMKPLIGMEIYQNSPMDTDPKDLITDLHVFIK